MEVEEKRGINPAIKIVLLVVFVIIACVSSWFIGRNMANEKVNDSKVQENANYLNDSSKNINSEVSDQKDGNKNEVSGNQSSSQTNNGTSSSNQVTNNGQTSSKVETRTVNSVEKSELMSVINDLALFDESVDKVDESSPLSNRVILKVAFDMASSKYGVPIYVPITAVNLYSNKYFGKDVVPADIPCFWDEDNSAIEYKYDSSTSRFVLDSDHMGHGMVVANVLNKFESATLNGNIYTVTVYKGFSDSSYNRLYSTYSDLVNDTNLLLEQDGSSNLESAFNSLDVSKLKKFTYTFEKKNGNYILKTYKMN